MAGTLVVAALLVQRAAGRPLTPFPAPQADPDAGPTLADFAGAAACRECHAVEHASWLGSTHGQAGGTPAARPPVRPFTGAPIRFADGVVLPLTGPDGGPGFVVKRDGLPDAHYTVEAVVGAARMVGGGTQGYLTRHADGTVRLLPWEQTEDGIWFCNTGTRADRGWQPITADMRLADCGDWPPRRVLGAHDRLSSCQECHGSQIATVAGADGTRSTTWRDLAIDCESCHGPAARHVEQARAGATTALPPLMTLDKPASVRLCLRCHGLKDMLRPGYLAGGDFEAHYSIGLAALSEDGLLPDGRTRGFAYQEGHLYSACYLDGGMTCVDCHAPHDQSYRTFQRQPLPDRFADGQCLSCHPSKAQDPRLHTRHAPASPGSRCVACHMPYLQQPDVGTAVRYGRSDHTISIPRPALDSLLGVRGACATCHGERSDTELAAVVDEWYGPLRPLHPGVMALVDPAAGSISGTSLPDLAAGHPMATLALLGRTLVRTSTAPDPTLDAPTRTGLLHLTRATDVDLAASAAAVLHYAHGSDRRTRRALIEALETHPRPELVRARWVAVMGWLGDTLAAAGHADRAILAYERALELRPADAAVLRSLGYARLRRGEHAAALELFRSAASAAPSDPLAHIGVGIAHAATGDDLAAAAAYREAIRVDPFEPLAHFNLGNVELRAGRAEEAIARYARAVALDPAMAAAHFNMARAQLALGRNGDAAAAIRAGLEFDRDNRAAADMLEQLTAQPSR